MVVLDWLRWLVCRRPIAVVAGWAIATAFVALAAPDLTRLAAEGQARLLPRSAESARGGDLIREAWPDQWYECMAVVALERDGGLTPADHEFARTLAGRFAAREKPRNLLRVLGPGSQKEVAERLISKDQTLELVVAQMADSFVAPSSEATVRWLQGRAEGLTPPPGLRVLWSGDAVIGRDYMRRVQQSLDRAAIVTVFLLLTVLLIVYRSLWLALVPLVTIGVGLVISRGVLGWMAVAGWDMSPLVELFLIVILFGCGTDFCLFLSWRFGEHWNASNPAAAMRGTLRRAMTALLTSAGTVIIGLCLMGTTKFKLFSSTGPSVALGLGLTLAACLTLAPALLILLARYRPRSFAGLTAPSSGFWDDIGHRVLARPVLTWLGTVAVLAPLAVLGMRSGFIQDLLTELPQGTSSVENLRLIARKFGDGFLAPLTVVVRSDADLHDSEGLALIDDVSRNLSHLRNLAEVRSATQPLGSSAPLEPARMAARLGAVNEGFTRMAEGADQLHNGLTQGAAKLRTAIQIEELTGLSLTGTSVSKANDGAKHDPVVSGLRQASSALLGLGRPETKPVENPKPNDAVQGTDPREVMLKELTRAAEGAGQIAEGARRAQSELTGILNDPVGRRALDRLLITPTTVRENPELLRSFAAYISKDGHFARIDIQQNHRLFSAGALDQVHRIRGRLHEYLDEMHDPNGLNAHAIVTGANAESYDIRALTRRDQLQTWIIVPLGVFIVLVLALRDVFACVNLVGTMLLTYAFALGATHLLFVDVLGAPGLDWKVPYFLFVLLVAVGVDYNVFLMARLQEEASALGLRSGINRAVAQTGGLITSAAMITACSFASFLSSPLGSIRQLGFALVVGITVDAVVVRPVLVPIGQWLMNRHRQRWRERPIKVAPPIGQLSRVAD